MDFSEIRRTVIIAMFSDEVLFHQLTLKGGNAVSLVYKFGSRTSVDIDFSLEADFSDIEDTKSRIFESLRKRFAEARYTVFDTKFETLPPIEGKVADSRWGGYEACFKLIETAKFESRGFDGERARREATAIGPRDQRIFKIQISKYEHCAGKREVDLDNYTIYVYTPEMLAIEKLRAICQQMPEYGKRGHPRPRARDFYDIFMIVTTQRIRLDSRSNLRLIADIFGAKDVNMRLIANIENCREFHRPDWASVRLSVTGELEEFDFYFDFVVQQAKSLESCWIK